MKFEVPTRAGKVRGEVAGAGGLVLLLHASLHDRKDWKPVHGTLADRHQVLALDWPSHGDSDRVDPRVLSAPLLADVLEDVLDELGEPVSIVGNSVGGFAAARAAARRPEQVHRLVFVDGGGFEIYTPQARFFCSVMGRPTVSRRIMGRFAKSYVRPRTLADQDVLRRVTERAKTDEGAATVSALWRSFPSSGHDLRAEAATIRAPTLVLWGTHDTAIPISSGRRAHSLIAGSTFAELATGHLPFSSDPVGFLRLVVPHLR